MEAEVRPIYVGISVSSRREHWCRLRLRYRRDIKREPSYKNGNGFAGGAHSRTEGRGRERSRLGLVRLLKKYFKKSAPLTKIPLHLLGGEGTKGLRLKTGGQSNPKHLPDVLKASHIQSPPSNAARHRALLLAASGRREIENGGGSGSQEAGGGEQLVHGQCSFCSPLLPLSRDTLWWNTEKKPYLLKKKKRITILQD